MCGIFGQISSNCISKEIITKIAKHAEQRGKDSSGLIFLDDSIEQMERKVKRAISGGQPTVEEHRRLGGDTSIDVAYQYLKFFFEDDDLALAEIHNDYESGRLLAGDLKRICIEKASEWLQNLSERRLMWEDRISEFLAPDAL